VQNDITEEHPHQVLAPPRVQQRYIQHHNVDLFLFGENPPNSIKLTRKFLEGLKE